MELINFANRVVILMNLEIDGIQPSKITIEIRELKDWFWSFILVTRPLPKYKQKRVVKHKIHTMPNYLHYPLYIICLHNSI